jgi:hypothetical protein
MEEMRADGFESDRATINHATIHLLCRSHLFEKACAEFEKACSFTRCLIKHPLSENITYKMVMKELKGLDLVELVDKLADLIGLSTTCCKVGWQLQRKIR